MFVADDRVVHRARWMKPIAYRATVADPPRRPRLLVLRGSCGHMLGVGYVNKHQGYVAWKTCRRG